MATGARYVTFLMMNSELYVHKHDFNSFRQDGPVNHWQSWSLHDSRNPVQTSETVDQNLIDINTSKNDSVKLKAITDLKKDTNLVTALDEADPAKSVSGRQIDADEWCDDSVLRGNTEQRDQEAEKEAEQKCIRKSYFKKEKGANFDTVWAEAALWTSSMKEGIISRL